MITCSVHTNKSIPKFSIYGRGIISRLFRKNPTSRFKVECVDSNFSKLLEQNIYLKSIYEIVEESPEFFPSIIGEMVNKKYFLTINFNTQMKNEKVLNVINEFCKNVVEIIIKK